jgi:hypothetical protein
MDNFQTGTLAILFTSLRIRVNNLIMELAGSLLQPPMALKTEDKWLECGHDDEKDHTMHTSL